MVFDQLLDHIVRIDRVLRQPLGHVVLVGASGAGKTVMTRFVAWLNGLATFQVAIAEIPLYNFRNFVPSFQPIFFWCALATHSSLFNVGILGASPGMWLPDTPHTMMWQIKAHRKYGQVDFEKDLRKVMRRAGCQGEKVCFIFDESNVLSPGFLELMNALLASGEVPGLFDGEDWPALMHQCKDAALREGKILDTDDELYRYAATP